MGREYVHAGRLMWEAENSPWRLEGKLRRHDKLGRGARMRREQLWPRQQDGRAVLRNRRIVVRRAGSR